MSRAEIGIREDFRRDGLAYNFWAGADLMRCLARALPSAIMNIGYPAVCEAEHRACMSIAEALEDTAVEVAVVGHAMTSHAESMAAIVHPLTKASGNVWVPISDYLLARTTRWSFEDLCRRVNNVTERWRLLTRKPLDVALVDCTAEEPLSERVACFQGRALEFGIRRIIICDTRGRGTPEQLSELFSSMPDPSRAEFHPHNDNGMALQNVRTAVAHGVTTIGTAAMCMGERRSMLDPVTLRRSFRFPLNRRAWADFRDEYGREARSLRILPDNALPTGAQRCLWGIPRAEAEVIGVTSDRAMLAGVLGRCEDEVSEADLKYLKNALYETKAQYFNEGEVRALLSQRAKGRRKTA